MNRFGFHTAGLLGISARSRKETTMARSTEHDTRPDEGFAASPAVDLALPTQPSNERLQGRPWCPACGHPHVDSRAARAVSPARPPAQPPASARPARWRKLA